MHRRAIVAGEEDQGVLVNAVLLERRENPAHAVVHARHHRQGRATTQRHLVSELAGVGGRQLQRRVRRVVTEVEEKGLVLVALEEGQSSVRLHVHAEALVLQPARREVIPRQVKVGVELRQFAAEVFVEALRLGQVTLALRLGNRHAPGGVRLLVRQILRGPSRAKRIGIEVPFAHHAAGVAGGFQALGDRHLLQRHRAIRDGINPEPLLVTARDQPHAGWRTLRRRDVARRATNAFGGHAVQARRAHILLLDLDAKVGIAQVVGDDDNDVRLGWRAVRSGFDGTDKTT